MKQNPSANRVSPITSGLINWGVIWATRWFLVFAMVLLGIGSSPAFAGAVLSSGVVTMGVNNEGNLIHQGVGLRYVPTGGEALAPGCYCEGWGVADRISGSFGKAGETFGKQNVIVESFTSTSSTARSVVRVVNGSASIFRVIHEYRVSPVTQNLFEASVTVQNISAQAVDVRYRRAMDWDVPPTTFSERVTIVTNGAQDVAFSSDNGFADGNPLIAAGALLFVGEATNSGPGDHGAIFDFTLGRLEAGASRMFSIFYGAAEHEPAALQALAAVGTEVYSLGKPNTPALTPPGSPNTFMFGFKGVGGIPAIVRDADVTIGGLDLIDNGVGQPASLVARLGNAGGKNAVGFSVAFYDGNPDLPSAVLLGTQSIAKLESEDFLDLRLDGITTLSGQDLYAVADRELRIQECSRQNNKVFIPSRPRSAGGSIHALTDRGTYGPTDVAVLAAEVRNTGRFDYAYQVRMRVEDAAGTLAKLFNPREVGELASGTATSVSETWNLSGVASGSYRLITDLFDLTGNRIDTSMAAFIVDSGVAGSAVAAKVVTDKASYSASETVRISDRITNLSVNTALDGLTAVTTVTGPGGVVGFSNEAALGQLFASGVRVLNFGMPLGGTTPGTYEVMLRVFNASGQEQARSQSVFTVLSVAETGSGLTGTVNATPKEVLVNGTVNLGYSVSNHGNAVLASQPVTLRVLNPATFSVLAEYSTTLDLAVSGTHSGSEKWVTSGHDGDVLVVVLTATVADKELTLAQDTFVLVKPPIELSITQAVSAHARILALASCVDVQSQTPDCDLNRADIMENLLNGLGIGYSIVTRIEDFESAFLSGQYNVYWLSGKQGKLDNDLAAEIREAIFRGEGLIVDGVHDERNRAIDEAAGVSYGGKQGDEGLVVRIDGPWFAPQSLATVGRAVTFGLEGSSQQASLVTRKGSVPGIVSHHYGAGQSLSFAFDLVESFSQEPGWMGVFGEGLSRVVPAATDSLTGGAYLPILTSVLNRGMATEVRVTTQLPLGADLVDSQPEGMSAETLAGTLVTWQFPLAEDGVRDLLLGVAVPLDTGTYHLSTIVETLDHGVFMPYEAPVKLAFGVRAQSERLSDSVTRIQSIGVTSQRDRQRRDQALDALQRAQRELANGEYPNAIGALLEVLERLRDISGADSTEARQAVDWLLKEAEVRWYRAER